MHSWNDGVSGHFWHAMMGASRLGMYMGRSRPCSSMSADETVFWLYSDPVYLLRPVSLMSFLHPFFIQSIIDTIRQLQGLTNVTFQVYLARRAISLPFCCAIRPHLQAADPIPKNCDLSLSVNVNGCVVVPVGGPWRGGLRGAHVHHPTRTRFAVPLLKPVSIAG
jgi:hypothetical protein